MTKTLFSALANLIALVIATSAFSIPPPLPGQSVPIRPMYAPGQEPQNRFIPQQQSDGIYSHQVYSAISRDMVTWQKEDVLIFDHASVPEAVIDAQGVIYLYFMDASERPDRMSVGLSRDAGTTWEKKSVEIAGRQTEGQAVDPNVMILKDGTFRMFYLATFGPPDPNQTRENHIGSALSRDGVHFTEEPGFRFSSSDRITDPDAIKTPSGWRMFLSRGQINLSTVSPDGNSFLERGPPTADDGAVSKTVPAEGGWRMFRCARGGIASQFTADFSSWKDEGARIVAEPGKMTCDPSVIKLPDGTYKMFYKMAPMAGMN
jgi:hypothetical protein